MALRRLAVVFALVFLSILNNRRGTFASEVDVDLIVPEGYNPQQRPGSPKQALNVSLRMHVNDLLNAVDREEVSPLKTFPKLPSLSFFRRPSPSTWCSSRSGPTVA